MEFCSEEKEEITKADDDTLLHKGGIRAVFFIVGSTGLALLATNGLRPNLILYLMKEYHLEMAKGSNMVFIWTAATYFTPIIAALLADSFIGRFYANVSGIIIAFLGMVLLWLTTMIPHLRPSSESSSSSSSSSAFATNLQLFILWASLGLISLGSGFIATSLSFGADQLGGENSTTSHIIKLYINWFYAFTTFCVFLAFSLLVYIQDKVGWKIGFGIPAVSLFFSFLVFILPSQFYVKLKAKSCWATQLLQVIVAAFRKRSIHLSNINQINYSYHHKEGSTLVHPSQNLRFLNRACIKLNIPPPYEGQLGENRTESFDLDLDHVHDQWYLCTVDQVEDLKSVIKVIPVWLIGMLMEVSMTQITILTLQAKSMNRKLGSTSFEIPPGSFAMFGMLSVALWVPIYNYIVLPIASLIKGKSVLNLGMKLRMGIGIFLACLCLVLNGTTENIRRHHAIAGGGGGGGGEDDKVSMSAMWLLPQLFLGGITESIFATAQIEFFYLELPRKMASTSSILFQVEYSIANLLSSLFMSITDNLSRKGGKESWISSNINKGHYDYFFWVISAFCMADMVLYLLWCKSYGPCKQEYRQITGEVHDDQQHHHHHQEPVPNRLFL